MILSPEALYLQLGRLVADMPDWEVPGPVSHEANTWLGRAAALVEQHADLADRAAFRVAAQNLDGVLRASNVQTIKSIVYAALARAELAAPLSVQGAFIQAGGTFDAFVAFGKAVETATIAVMIVDPYADAKALTDFAVQVPDGVAVRILADGEYHKATLRPAMQSWKTQHGASRQLEVRLTPKKALHDRLILVDDRLVWTLGQSLNAIAVRAPTSIVRVDSETAALKVVAYAGMWAAATPI
jgi:hypothetical protein